jgi:hypothetical protein
LPSPDLVLWEELYVQLQVRAIAARASGQEARERTLLDILHLMDDLEEEA